MKKIAITLFIISILVSFKTVIAQDTWIQQTNGSTESILDLFVLDANTIWTSGLSASILNTTNGGSTWTTQLTGNPSFLWGIFFTDANTGWAVGASGGILNTTNGGSTWSAQTSGSGATLFKPFSLDGTTAWVVGLSGTILKTTNGGTNWSAQTSGTAVSLDGVQFIDANTGWIIGNSGTILKTTNGGTTWAAQTSGTTNWLIDLHFIDANTGWATGLGGIILKTTDGGSNWATKTSGITTDLRSIRFIDSNTGWIAGVAGTILVTSDGGSTWNTQASGTSIDLLSLMFTDANTGWISGGSGFLAKFSPNSIPTISNINDQTMNKNGNTGALSFTIADSDTTASSLTVTGTSSNSTLVPNSNIVFGGSGGSRTVTVTPASNQSGSATITVTVSDSFSTAPDTFVVTVGANVSPFVTTNTGISVLNGASVTITSNELKITDADNTASEISLSITTIPSNGILSKSGTALAVNSNFTQADIDNNVIKYTHNGSTATKDSLVFVVADGDGGSISSTSFVFTISDLSLTIDTLSAMTFTEGDKIDIDVNVTYNGSNSLEFSLDAELPNGAGASFNSSTRRFLWNTNFKSSGEYRLNFTVTDGVLTDTETKIVTVTDLDFNKGVTKADTAVVSNSKGGSVKVKGTGIYKEHKVDIPPGALDGDKTIIVGPPETDDISQAELEDVPSAVDFVIQGSESGFNFSKSVEITIEFKNFEVKKDKKNMRVHTWNHKFLFRDDGKH